MRARAFFLAIAILVSRGYGVCEEQKIHLPSEQKVIASLEHAHVPSGWIDRRAIVRDRVASASQYRSLALAELAAAYHIRGSIAFVAEAFDDMGYRIFLTALSGELSENIFIESLSPSNGGIVRSRMESRHQSNSLESKLYGRLLGEHSAAGIPADLDEVGPHVVIWVLSYVTPSGEWVCLPYAGSIPATLPVSPKEISDNFWPIVEFRKTTSALKE